MYASNPIPAFIVVLAIALPAAQALVQKDGVVCVTSDF